MSISGNALKSLGVVASCPQKHVDQEMKRDEIEMIQRAHGVE